MWVWLVVLGIVVAVGLTLYQEARQQIFVLAVVNVLQHRGKKDAAKKFLERAVNEKTLLGERSKANTRYRLAWIYMDEGNYGAAAAQLRAALSAAQKPNLEVMLRQRLADCLEGLGDPAGATAERQQIAGMTREAPRDTDWYLNEARRLEGAQQYDAACAVYRAALGQLPANLAPLRPTILTRLALATFNAGHAEETVRYAEEALGLNPDANLRNTAHSVAGLGYSSMGRLDESEVHRQRAYELAVAAGNQDQAARYLVTLGLVQMKRGKLVEAIQASQQAVQMSLAARRQARMVEADCMRLRGEWDQARAAYEQARNTKPDAKPSSERRSQAILALALAQLEAECGNAETAGRLLDGAPELAEDPKLSLWSQATRAWVLAQQGQSDAARVGMQSLLTRLQQTGMDEEVKRNCYGQLGHAAQALGDAAGGAEYWQRYLSLRPDPAYRPTGLYHLAQCRLQLGETEAARAALQEAVDMGLQTHYTREARRLISDFG